MTASLRPPVVPETAPTLPWTPSTERQAVQPSPAVRPMPTSAAGSPAPVSVQTSTSQGPRKPAEPAGLSDPARGHPAVDVNGHSARSPRPAAAHLAVASPDRATVGAANPRGPSPAHDGRRDERARPGSGGPGVGAARSARGRHPRRLPGRDRAAGSTKYLDVAAGRLGSRRSAVGDPGGFETGAERPAT